MINLYTFGNNSRKQIRLVGVSPQVISLPDNKLETGNEHEKQPIVFNPKLEKGIVIHIDNNISHSKLEKIVVVTNNSRDDLDSNQSRIEIDIFKNSISVDTQMDLSIRAKSIQIEAKENMKIKSGATMTINGSLVKIN
jgi:hypothetical protein